MTGRVHADERRIIGAHVAGCSECAVVLAREVALLPPVGAAGIEALEQQRLSGNSGWLQPLHPFSLKLLEVWLIDVSEDEVRLMAYRDVEPGSLVLASFKHVAILGFVEYYDSVEESYYLTVKFAGSPE